MKLDDYYKAECLLREINKEEGVLQRIKKLSTQQKSKKISNDDIQWLIQIAYEATDYLKSDLERKFNDL